MISLTIGDGQRAQEFSQPDFPLSIQLDVDGAVVFDSDASGFVVAWLIAHSDGVSVQPEQSKAVISLNGQILEKAAWVHHGDVLAVGRTSFDVQQDGPVFRLMVQKAEHSAVPTLSPDFVAPSESSDKMNRRRQSRRSVGAGSRARLTRGKAIVLSFVMALTVSVALVASTAPLSLRFDPEPDTVDVSGFPPVVPVADGYLALPGEYTVKASKEGYRPFEQKVQVTFSTKEPFRFSLQKAPGLVRLSTVPDGGKVFVDGVEQGSSPTLLELDPGERRIRVEKERYLPEERSVLVEGLRKEQALEIKLQPAWANVSITSKPDQATVKVDGTQVGETPITVEVLRGNRTIEVAKEGWKSAQRSFEIQAGATTTLPLVELERLDGSIRVESEPSGAAVLLNGQFQGQTPLTVTAAGDKSHQISVSKAGFETSSRSVRAEPGGTSRVAVELQPEFGVVYLTTTPAGATLKVNGADSGSGTQRLSLRTVQQTLEISKPGYQTHTITVTPQKNVAKRIEVVLKTEGEALKAKAAEGIRTPGGQLMVLVPITGPVRVTLGSSRRDPARRSNESDVTVELTRAYLLSEKEVTNAEYQKFKAGHNSGSHQGVSLSEPTQPVVNVSWEDSARYANWLSQQERLTPAYRESGGKIVPVSPTTDGYRLPTEAEWEFAARYDGGLRTSAPGLRFSWGDAMPPAQNSGNYAHDGSGLPFAISGYADKFLVSAPVGSFPAGRSGLFDMSGNVSEWCHDFYDIISAAAPIRDPMGPNDGRFHVIKGSSWRTGSATELRLAYRDYADKPRDDLGFRIARYANAAK